MSLSIKVVTALVGEMDWDWVFRQDYMELL